MPSTSRPNILFVDYGVSYGGSIVSLSALIKGLTELSFTNITVVTFQPLAEITNLFPNNIKIIHFSTIFNYQNKQNFEQALKHLGGPSIANRFILKLYGLLIDLNEAFVLRKLEIILRKNKIDTLHLNNGFKRNAISLAKKHDVKTFVHIRGIPKLEDYSGKKIDAVLAAYVNRYFAISKVSADAALNIGVPKSKLEILPNPIDYKQFSSKYQLREKIRSQYSLTEKSVVFGIFGRLTYWKGQLELVNCAIPLLKRYDHMHLMVVGNAANKKEEEYLERIQSLLKQHTDVQARVIFTGYQSDVAAYYAATDVVVHNSSLPEPFGRVIIEGMAGRNAVIAMDEGGPKDIISHGNDGLLVTPRDSKALYKAMEQLYLDSCFRERLSLKALTTVKNNFCLGINIYTC